MSTTGAAPGPAKVIQENLGQSTITLTLDTYTSIYREVAAEAAEAAVGLVPRADTSLQSDRPSWSRSQPQPRAT